MPYKPDDDVGGGGGSAQAAWPVGAIFFAYVATDPSILLGFGTWEAYSPGWVLTAA